jgi:uncharacterized protein YlzI (FlbEa/FlbD family)
MRDTFYLQKKDIECLTKLAEMVTPLDNNKSMIVREAIHFANFHVRGFSRFVRSRAKKEFGDISRQTEQVADKGN